MLFYVQLIRWMTCVNVNLGEYSKFRELLCPCCNKNFTRYLVVLSRFSFWLSVLCRNSLKSVKGFAASSCLISLGCLCFGLLLSSTFWVRPMCLWTQFKILLKPFPFSMKNQMLHQSPTFDCLHYSSSLRYALLRTSWQSFWIILNYDSRNITSAFVLYYYFNSMQRNCLL